MQLVDTPIAPAHQRQVSASLRFIDFGRAVFGTVELELNCACAGHVLRLHLGEKLAANGRLDRAPGATVRYREIPLKLKAGRHRYRLVIPADARNTGARAIKMSPAIGEVLPFRYCEIEALIGGIELLDVRQRFVHAPFDDTAAAFECSDPVLNEVWELCRHTIKATTFCGLYVDGDRERIPYEGDAYINQLSHYCLDASYGMAQQTIDYLIEHPTWPSDWHLHMTLIAWYDFLYSGDQGRMRAHYAMLKLKTLHSLAGRDGLISAANSPAKDVLMEQLGMDGFFNEGLQDMVDWPRHDFTQNGLLGEADAYVFSPVNTAINALHHRSLILMARIAGHLGEVQDQQFFESRARQVAASINQQLFDTKRGIYVDGNATEHASLHANFYPLLAGIVPVARQAGVLDFVKSRAMACSVYGVQHLLDALYKCGASDHALSLMTSKSDRSWWHMIHRVGSTMTLEAWDARYKPNLDWNHAWGAAPSNIIIRRLMGVRPAAPGFRQAIIQPQLGGLEWARAKVPTAHGSIEIEVIHAASGKPVIECTLPDGVERV
ncbi:MAG TPA: alpha-L-rhamnosidase [Opitutae bacterium]|nr:alpha-L-rhamnosidase [Puniceicoccaceae bacterium]HBR94604.1 alpha-L-rhamnosidase [Opitutae bacterium]|tara:strand:+ start:167 stop:1813 length:1647 start_codon:yes stop_codon:yes gene_type:complete